MTGDYPTGHNAEGYQPFLQNPESQSSAAPNPPPAGTPYPPYAPGAAYPPPPPTDYPAYPGYGVQPYGVSYPYYAGPVAPSTNGFAIASLILSISGFVLLGIVGSILGVIFGHVAQGQIKKAVPREEGHGLATAGIIMGYIGIGVNILILLFFLFFVIILPIIAVNSSPSSP
jgi:ABC-type dipeptide/oligopeptide/nickel transport system permease component